VNLVNVILSMLHSKRHKLKPTSQRVLNTEKYVIFSYPCNTFWYKQLCRVNICNTWFIV